MKASSRAVAACSDARSKMNLLLLLVLVIGGSESANILALFPLALPSHHRFVGPVLKELCAKGHHVTLITAVRHDNRDLPNCKQVVIDGTTFRDAEIAIDSSIDQSSYFFSVQKYLWNASLVMTENALNTDAMKSFIYSTNHHFDLIIYDMHHHEAFLMFAHKYKVPTVAFSSEGHSPILSNIMGSSLELAYSSNPLLDMSETGDCFIERLKNSFWTTWELWERNRGYLKSQQQIAEKYFQYLESPLPSLSDIEKNTSLVLVNSHFSLGSVRSLVPGVVEVGGIHLKHASALPKAVASFMDSSKDGVIYLSVSEEDPSDKLFGQLFIKSFSQMKLSFVFESELLEGGGMAPRDRHNNILFTKPLPSHEVLANPKVKLIITQGSHTHLQDAIAFGIPILVIPALGSQKAIAQKVINMGIGEELNINKLLEEPINNTINNILNNKEYYNNVQKLQNAYRDRPMDALDTAIYWIEYVLRYDGASQLASPAKNLSWIKYYMVDVTIFMILCTVLLGIFIHWFWFNVALRKRLPRSEELNRLIEKEKQKTK